MGYPRPAQGLEFTRSGHEFRPHPDDAFLAFFGVLNPDTSSTSIPQEECMSRMRIAIACGVVVAAASLSAVSAFAAPPTTDSQNQTVKFTNRASVQLTLDTPTVNFGNVDPLSQASASGGNANVKANAAWTLSMAAPANFTEDAGGSNTIPIGRLSLSPNGGAYSAVAAGSNAVSSGARTTGAGADTTLAYHLDLTFGDNPNTAGNAYQAVLVYTATTP
jgi:hypothetical protein